MVAAEPDVVDGAPKAMCYSRVPRLVYGDPTVKVRREQCESVSIRHVLGEPPPPHERFPDPRCVVRAPLGVAGFVGGLVATGLDSATSILRASCQNRWREPLSCVVRFPPILQHRNLPDVVADALKARREVVVSWVGWVAEGHEIRPIRTGQP